MLYHCFWHGYKQTECESGNVSLTALVMEDLFQAWGRAGRDGLPAKCFLYFSFEDRVFHVRNSFDHHDFDSKRQTSSLLRFQRVLDFVMFKECRRKKLITYFSPEEAGLALCDDCDICKDSVANTPLTNDYTPQITRIIELFQVAERPITIKYLAQVASGKMNKKIRENRDEHSSIFSIFKCTVIACELFLRHAVTKWSEQLFLLVAETWKPVLTVC